MYNYHSGFRKNHSTDFMEIMLIDLQKAFDTINHKILLRKLHAIGFYEKTMAWFKSYLSDRVFKVNINSHFSNVSKISCGVPQGSILGPILFSIYVNDIPQSRSFRFIFICRRFRLNNPT